MSTDPQVLLAVAANPASRYFILYRLIPSRIESEFDDEMAALLAVHSDVPFSVLNTLPGLLAGRLDGAPAHARSFSTALALCSRSNVPGARLAEMLAEPTISIEFKEQVARTSPRPDILGVLAADESDRVRGAVAANPVRPAVEFRLEQMLDLSATVSGREIRAAGIGADETVALLVENLADEKEAVLLAQGADIREVAIDMVNPHFSAIQPLSDGGFVLANRRAASRDDLNARRYDSAGQVVTEFFVDDAFEHLLVDRDDQIWVGYFDEGVFGGREYSQAGLCRFDGSGRLAWSFSPPEGGKPIYDCYALNIANDAVWVYYYDSYDLVRIDHRGATRRWATPIVGAGIVACDESRVLALGGSAKGQPRDLCQIWELGQNRLESPRPVVTFPFLERLTNRVFARGPLVFFVDGPRVFRGDIRSIGSPTA